jgi:hypothetical protein
LARGEIKEEISSCDMAKSVQMKKERWLGDKKNLWKMNIGLLCKWWWLLET